MGCLYFKARGGSYIMLVDKITKEDATKHMRVPYVGTWEDKNGVAYYDAGHNGFYLFIPEGCNHAAYV